MPHILWILLLLKLPAQITFVVSWVSDWVQGKRKRQLLLLWLRRWWLDFPLAKVPVFVSRSLRTDNSDRLRSNNMTCWRSITKTKLKHQQLLSSRRGFNSGIRSISGKRKGTRGTLWNYGYAAHNKMTGSRRNLCVLSWYLTGINTFLRKITG